jgi:ABC-type transport system substrate-binding protein
MVGEPATLDPYARDASDLTFALVRPVFRMPYRLLPDGEVETDLAETLEVSGGSARLTLVPAEWSNGERIDARDVVASIRRARLPSGFAAVTSARAVSRRVVELRGDVTDWEETLASGAYVLPDGHLRRGALAAGPFRFTRYNPGRSLEYEPNEGWSGTMPGLDRVTVSFVQSTDLLVQLLVAGRVDAAAVPSSVNLDERLTELGLDHDTMLGWESIALAFESEDVTQDEWIATAYEIDRDLLLESFIRDDGRLSNTLAPGPQGTEGFWSHVAAEVGPPLPELAIAAPEGDELLSLIQRALQLELERAGSTVEVITAPWATYYGRWRDGSPADAALIRVAGAPGATGPANSTDAFILPLAHVETTVAWRDGIDGLSVNPTLDGVLWNLVEWWRDPSI